MLREWREQRNIRESMIEGRNLFMYGDYEGSLSKYNQALLLARDNSPADAASYNIGLIYVHPNNPKRNTQKAIDSFKNVIANYPESVWAEQAKIWISTLEENEKSKQEVERSRQEVEQSKQVLEKSKVDLERYKQTLDKSRQEIDKSRQESEKSKAAIEKSNQIDIEIEQKKRDRGK